ncbi:MAG: phospho-N-acetylmuramoyl-pentapeptide-transferase [bacterium]|nr:phospho-N-acetylmuramoyl-pentapeptide-transferase [bacterium]
MIMWLAHLLRDMSDGLSFLRLTDYLSFRAVMATMTTFSVSLIIGRPMIQMLHRKGMRDVVEDFGVLDVKTKRGTPTMGGLIIIAAFLAGYLLWCDLTNPFAYAGLFACLGFGTIGFIDDLGKVRGGGGKFGLSQSAKLILQILLALVLVWWVMSNRSPLPENLRTLLFVPFKKSALLDLGWFYAPFMVFVILAVSNSVNFADGMDGLATVPAAISFMVYAVLGYVIGNEVYSTYLHFDYIHGSGEITVIGGAVLGACMGFLWYNSYPAQVFMGDTGSMALGGLLSVVIILLKQEMLFIIVGGIFVVEGASVLIQQQIGFAVLGRRLLLRAPIHHAFERQGIAETKIVIRFWMVALILGFVGLLSLKIR